MKSVIRVAAAALCLVACDSGDGVAVTVGASVSGLRGTGLVLQNNAGDSLAIDTDGSFTFEKPLRPFARYSVTVLMQPIATPAEVCSIANGEGFTRRASVTQVEVTCHSATGKFLYLANQQNTVSGFSIDPATGALTELPGSPFAIDGYPPEGREGLLVDRAGKFLFIAGRASGGAAAYSLTGYAIESATGALTQIPEMPITSASSFIRAFFHPNGAALYVPTIDDGLHAYSIHPTSGALTPQPGQPYRFPDDWPPRRGAFDLSGSTMFLASGPSFNPSGNSSPPSRVSAFAVDSTTGALTLLGTSDYTKPAGDIIVHPGGRYAYMWGAGYPVAVIAIENPRSLSVADAAILPPVGGAVFALPFGAILPESGRHAYFGYNLQLLIGGRPAYFAAYHVDAANGALTAVAGSPYVIVGGGGEARGVVMDPTDRYIIATRLFSPNIAVLERDTVTGELEHVPGSPFLPAVGTTPLGVTFDPSGTFAYLPDAATFSVSAYSFDPTTGRPDFIGSYPVGSSPATLARIVGLQ